MDKIVNNSSHISEMKHIFFLFLENKKNRNLLVEGGWGWVHFFKKNYSFCFWKTKKN